VTHASFARKDASAGARHPRACVHVRTRTGDSERKCTGMRYLRGTFVPRLVLFVPRSSCLLRPCLMHESCTRRTTMTTTTVTSHTCAIGPVAGVSRSRFRDVDISHFRKGILIQRRDIKELAKIDALYYIEPHLYPIFILFQNVIFFKIGCMCKDSDERIKLNLSLFLLSKNQKLLEALFFLL